MRMFKNANGELLRVSRIDAIVPISQWMGDPVGLGTETHVVCTAAADYPLYGNDFERLMQVLETVQD